MKVLSESNWAYLCHWHCCQVSKHPTSSDSSLAIGLYNADPMCAEIASGISLVTCRATDPMSSAHLYSYFVLSRRHAESSANVFDVGSSSKVSPAILGVMD